MTIDPVTERTVSVTEHGTRTEDDRRTHTERINGAKGGRFGDAEAIDEPDTILLASGERVVIDYDAPRRPYRTTEQSVYAGARVSPGAIVWLQPHEVGAHHVAMLDPEIEAPVEMPPPPPLAPDNEQPPPAEESPAPMPEAEAAPEPIEEPPHAEEAAAPEVA